MTITGLLAVPLLGASFVSVQVGSLTDETKAVHLVEELRGEGYHAYFLRYPSPEDGASTWKIRVGRFDDTGAARPTVTKIKALGHEGAFAATTDLQGTSLSSEDLVALVAALGSVNPGRIAGDAEGRQLRLYAQNYLTLFLLAAGQDPGRTLTDLAVWDTNPDNQPEIFAVMDAARAYALYWVKEQSRYELQELYRGNGVAVGESFDLTPGPEKFVSVSYQEGGDLYLEKGIALIRWDQPRGSFGEVGRIPVEVTDKGEEAGQGISRKRTVEPAAVDLDRDRELVVVDRVESGGQVKEHVDVWDWNGKRIDRVEKSEWFEKILEADSGNEIAANGLFGAGIEKGLDGDLKGAQAVFQLMVTRYPSSEVALRAQQAIKQIGERREKAQVLNQTGFDEIRAGAPALAAQDLKQAVLLDPGCAQAHYNLAVARTASGDSLGALRSLRRAVDLDTDGSMKLRDKARSDRDLGMLRENAEFKEILR